MSVNPSNSADLEIEPVPDWLENEFGSAAEKLIRYTNFLLQDGEALGLLGPREYSKIWSRHILNSAASAKHFNGFARVADVGSGAGLPGIPLAILQPGITWTLIEPMQRRANWLTDRVAELGLSNVRVDDRSAQEVPKGGFDAVTARAVSALKNLIPMCAPLVSKGGSLIFLKGKSALDEINSASKQLAKAGITNMHVVEDSVRDATVTLVIGTVGR